MFSKGQVIFAICFAIVFVVIMAWSYRKDTKLHQYYYKNVWVVGLGVILAIFIFTVITFWLHE